MKINQWSLNLPQIEKQKKSKPRNDISTLIYNLHVKHETLGSDAITNVI